MVHVHGMYSTTVIFFTPGRLRKIISNKLEMTDRSVNDETYDASFISAIKKTLRDSVAGG